MFSGLIRLVLAVLTDSVVLVVQEEHQQEMEEVLATRTLLGLSSIRELSVALRSSVETQRVLADQVSPNKLLHRHPGEPEPHCLSPPSGGGHEGDWGVFQEPGSGAGGSAAGHGGRTERAPGGAGEAGAGDPTGPGEAPEGKVRIGDHPVRPVEPVLIVATFFRE